MSTQAISNAQLLPGTSRRTNLQRTQIMRSLNREKTDMPNMTCIFRVFLTSANIPSPGLHASATRQSTTSSLVTALGCKICGDTLSIVRWRRRPRCPGHLWKHRSSHGRHRGAAWFEDHSVSHLLTILLWPGMFGYALKHPIKKANHLVRNHRELTSLTLSCLLGRF